MAAKKIGLAGKIGDGIIVLKAYTVKPVYNEHPRDPKIVVVVARWSLLRGHLFIKSDKWDHNMVFVVDRWLLLGGTVLVVCCCICATHKWIRKESQPL